MPTSIADAKAKPDNLNYGSWSIGNPVHLGSEVFESTTGTKMGHVVYKETSQLYTGVANGDIAWALGSYGTSGSLQRSGKIRYLAVAGPKRLAAHPDIPTVAEAGGPKDFEVSGWTMLAAPKSINPAIANKIRQDIEKVLQDPEILKRYESFGYEPFPANTLNAYMASESAKYADVIKKGNISLE